VIGVVVAQWRVAGPSSAGWVITELRL